MTETQTYTFIEPDGTRIKARRRKNPDGSIGGWVADNAVVGPNAIVEPGAVVEPRAVVPSGLTVRSGKIVQFSTTFGET